MSLKAASGDSQLVWSIQPDWDFHQHADASCSAFHRYSGIALALNEASGWVVRCLQETAKTTAELEESLAIAADQDIDDNLQQALAATLDSLLTVARIVTRRASP